MRPKLEDKEDQKGDTCFFPIELKADDCDHLDSGGELLFMADINILENNWLYQKLAIKVTKNKEWEMTALDMFFLPIILHFGLRIWAYFKIQKEEAMDALEEASFLRFGD